MTSLKKAYILGVPNAEDGLYYRLTWNYYICDTEADLPLEKVQAGDEAFVKSSNKTFKGTEGGTWIEKVGILSSPLSGKYRVTNLYVDPSTGKLVVEYDDTPVL